MTDQTSSLPAAEIAMALMRNALVLLDYAGATSVAAALQNAIDTFDQQQAGEPD